MKYDIDDVKLRVEGAKRKFKVALFICTVLISLSILVAIYIPETTVVFLCAVAVVLSTLFLIKFLKNNNPLITFSKGFIGENVKEHEYVIGGTRIYRYGGIRYRYHPSKHKGDVYVRLENGEITVVSCLPKKHLDIFEIGDVLICYPGTKYPNVANREVREQPCPICGYVNEIGDENCSSCGLEIAKYVNN